MAGHTGMWKGLVAAAMMLGIAACNPGEDPVPPPPEEAETGEVVERSRTAQEAAEARERLRQERDAAEQQRFAYIRYAPDMTGDQPKACLVFSSALDPDADYSAYVTLDGSTRPALDVNGRELCLSGLAFAESYTATLREGLPANDGRELGRQEEVSISFDDRPPYVGFKGSGVILPRDQADGVPIETVNVDALDITVFRINDRALAFKSITQGETSGQGSYSYLYGDEDPRDVSEEIWSGSMDVDMVVNAPVTTVFPLPDVIEDLERGSYYIELKDAKELDRYDGPPASARRWIMLTNLALTAYRGESGLDVTLRSLQDGMVLANTPIQLVAQNNEVLAERTTDDSGRARFGDALLAGTGNMSPRLVLAYGAKGDLAVLDLTRAPVDLSEMSVDGRRTPGDVDGFVYFERGIYRPGETVHITALMRNRAGRAITDRPGTLKVYRPNGLVAFSERFGAAESGARLADYELPASAARGMWRASLEIDGIGEVGSERFAVEDFVPQRIAVELETDEETPVRAGETRDIEVDARFLYGAPGAGLVVKTTARVEPDPSPFEGFDGYHWGRHDEPFRERIVEIDDTTTDGAGLANVRLTPGDRGTDADRPLRLNTNISVLEPGGRAVTESVRLPYGANPPYLGIKPKFDGRVPRDGEASFEVALVNAAGETLGGQLDWRVLAIDYHYDWYREGGSWRWRRSRTVRTVNEGALDLDLESATVSVDGLDWGQHELVLAAGDGEIEASYGFSVGWGGSVSDEGVEAPDRVRVVVDEQNIVPGRPAVVTIVPPYDGEAEIVVATDRVLSVERRDVSAEGTEVRLPVEESWGEGAYVLVNVYTPRDPVVQSRPRRAVGVGYVPVNMEPRTFEVAIEAPELARPRRKHTIGVDVTAGPRENIYMTVAAVDEGILRLTNYQTPDPVDYYFGKKALGVELHDDYGRLLDPNMGLPAEVRSGGDQLGGEGLSVVPTESVALFSGLVEAGRNGKARIDLDVPAFNGELRIMAVAWSQSGLGSASQALTVRDEAPADLVLPRFLAPGDTAIATLSIDNVELPNGEFTAELETSGPVSIAASEVARMVASGERADSAVQMSATREGIADLSVSVEGPRGYSVSKDYQIQSRSAFLPVTQVSRELMAPGDSWTTSPELLMSYVPGSVETTVTFSSLPVDANALYESLARYPYGCTEQTVSRAMPLLYSEQLVAMGADDDRPAARAQVQEAITRVLNRQSSDGAFGLWREGDGYASPWLGAYTSDFLYRAREAGYEVPQTALDRAYSALRTIGQGEAWRIYGYNTNVYPSQYHQDTETRLMQRSAPYALYVLAKAGEADITRLRYLHDRELDRMRSPLATAQLAAALSYMGDKARAKSAFEAAVGKIGYTNNGDYYQTALRDLAGVLALAAETDFLEEVVSLSERLGEDVRDPSELSTQEKAFLLLAVNGLDRGSETLEVSVSGMGAGNDNDPRYRLSGAQVNQGIGFTLGENASPLFRTVMTRGSPQSAPPAAQSSLGVTKRIATLQGSPVDLGAVRQGDQMVIAITLTPEQRRTNPIIVADLLPAGFEIEAVLRPADGAREGNTDGAYAWLGEIDAAQTAEKRDDRFVAAIDVRDEPVRLAYVVRAVTPGDFALPGVTAEDMYRPDVFARSEPGRVSISADGSSPGGQR